ncbi:MAG: outer membrane protein transport protein, partial [Muribaculaceae bacterium]|nr:outer membrane protein transport protein [Muribaculaceae bacterium]
MKKIFISLMAMTTSLVSMAEGYQVNTLSARQNGMGHTGTALKLRSESMIFNPAGLGFMDEQLDLSGSITAIFATGNATLPNGSKYTTDNTASTPMSANLGFSIYPNLKAGISFYTPYGSNINWTDNWPGAMLNQSVKLSCFTVQPTLAWKITPSLSVGAGLMLTWGNVDLNKGLVSPAISGGITPAAVNLNGTASMAFGANVGAMYDISSQWTVGASFRSKMNMKVKSGLASVNYTVESLKPQLSDSFGTIDQTNFKAEMPCVSILNIGTAYKPNSRWTFALDAQLSFWNQYKTLCIDFDLPDTPITLPSGQTITYDQVLPKNYRNSWTFHAGAEWKATERFDLRCGIVVDTAPMRTDNYNPETPGMTKIEPSVGF